MLGISAYDSNSLSTLFSSIGRSTSSNSGSSLASLTSSLSDYQLIRSGSYKKLMTAYFAKTGNNNAVRQSYGSKTTNAVSKDSATTLSNVKSAAQNLEDSASKLLKTGTNSVFKQESKKDENGKTVNGYNTDNIYKAVKEFVDDYNSVVKAADDANSSGVRKSAVSMINSTSKYASSLSKIGITIDSDNYQLSIDKDTFMKADMNQVKSLFNGSGSYAYNVKAQASMIEYKAENEASKANTYTYSGRYNSVYNSGSMWDSYF